MPSMSMIFKYTSSKFNDLAFIYSLAFIVIINSLQTSNVRGGFPQKLINELP